MSDERVWVVLAEGEEQVDGGERRGRSSQLPHPHGRCHPAQSAAPLTQLLHGRRDLGLREATQIRVQVAV